MIPQSADELSRLLVDMQLLSATDAALTRKQLSTGSSGAEYLDLLERQQLLTSFQVQRLQKGETEGLVLGGCKLMYRNAAGSFARVYRACRLDNGQMVGMKVLRERWSSDPDTVQLFRREGEFGKRLKHPHIVPIYDVGSSGKFHYITMEFIEGGNLRDFLKIRGKLTPVEACRYGLHIARGLEGALKLGITHRDMKTTNVLMTAQGIAKLIDFGLAADDAFLNRVSSPDLAQALEYSTLEKNTNAPRNDPRSDLFFLGTILFELLAGSPPYPRTRDREERKRFGRYRDVPLVERVAPALPWSVSSVVNKLLQTNPENRHQSPTELAEELEKILEELGEPVASGPAAVAEETDNKILLCVESRPSRQDLLRDYFTRHGYRVLLLGDGERALTRLKSSAPRGLVLFGDVLGDRIVETFHAALEATRGGETIVAAVLGDRQQELASQLESDNPRAVVLHQPLRLRDLRKSLEELLE